MALAVHGHPRFTKDIDLLVRGDDLEKIRKAVGERGFTSRGVGSRLQQVDPRRKSSTA